MQIRLQKILAEAGLASRREAERLIEEGEVTVNGKVAQLGQKADPSTDHIKLRGKLLPRVHKEKIEAYLVNKPNGFLSLPPNKSENLTPSDERAKLMPHCLNILEELGPKKTKTLKAVGRLDRDAEGLLILTNDGELAQRLNQSRYEIPKRYEVKIDGHLEDHRIKRLKRGFQVEGKRLKLIELGVLRSREGKEWITVKTADTQNRLIRKMFEAVGRPVDKVKRSHFADFNLKGVKRGEFRPLEEEEIQILQSLVGLAEAPEGMKPVKAGPSARPSSGGKKGSQNKGKPGKKPGSKGAGHGRRPASGRSSQNRNQNKSSGRKGKLARKPKGR